MAKSTSRPPKKPTPIDASTPFDALVDDMSSAEVLPPEQVAEEPVPKANGQPWTQPAKSAKTPTFLDTMGNVPKGDWGPRANIYLYRVEPVIDRTRSGDSKYINCYAEPIDEDRVMGDYGSGRYKLILNFRKPGAATGDIIDSTYWDIQNMKYPPKIPLGEWTDDPRNKKWAWAKEAASTQPNPTPLPAAPDPLAAFGTFMDIQDRVEERLKPQQPAAAVTVDPWAAAEKILNMRSDNPMVEILKEQMKASAASAEAERDRAFKAAETARDREFKLQEKLLEAKTDQPPTKSFWDQAMELASNPDKLEPIKKLAQAFGFGNSGETVRASRTTGMDILNNLVSGPAGAALAQGLGQLLMAAPSMLAGNPANGQPPMHPPPPVLQPQVQQGGPPQPETPEQRINRVGAQVTRQMIGEFFMKGATGEDFAVSMYNFWPEDTEFLQSFGAENLVDRYRKFPQAWAVLSYREAEFITFMQQFCAWKAPTEDDRAAIPAEADGVEDLEDGAEAQV